MTYELGQQMKDLIVKSLGEIQSCIIRCGDNYADPDCSMRHLSDLQVIIDFINGGFIQPKDDTL